MNLIRNETIISTDGNLERAQTWFRRMSIFLEILLETQREIEALIRIETVEISQQVKLHIERDEKSLFRQRCI